jgi:hypothetical protein
MVGQILARFVLGRMNPLKNGFARNGAGLLSALWVLEAHWKAFASGTIVSSRRRDIEVAQGVRSQMAD